MPELPDVEVFRRYFDNKALGRRIVNISADSSILEKISEKDLASALNGRSFESTSRHGKNMFAKIAGGKWLVIHFGMTGFLKYYQGEGQKPKHERMWISFSNGHKLAFDCQRKLGRIRLAGSMEEFIAGADLGPDAASGELTLDIFRNRISPVHGYLKTTLMNQSVIAGIGNVYADEILYQARIHPKRRSDDLDEKRLETLYKAMRMVLKTAVDCNADPDKLPGDFILRIRGTEADCPCGGRIEKIRISGRNGYYCPECQV